VAEQFGVTPPELHSVSGDLHGVSSRMKGVLSSLRAQLAGEGAAWGNDSIGHQFANGANGYLAQADWVEGSVDAKTNLLDYYSDQLRNAADTFEQSDERSGPDNPTDHERQARNSYSLLYSLETTDGPTAAKDHGVNAVAITLHGHRSGAPHEPILHLRSASGVQGEDEVFLHDLNADGVTIANELDQLVELQPGDVLAGRLVDAIERAVGVLVDAADPDVADWHPDCSPFDYVGLKSMPLGHEYQ
jgi:uncharacterized protein YukE